MPNADAAERREWGKGRAALGAACLSDHFPRIGFWKQEQRSWAVDNGNLSKEDENCLPQGFSIVYNFL